MRIHHLILTSRFAGSERYALELAAAQAATGHEVSVVLRRSALEDRPDAPGRYVDPGLRVLSVPDWLPGWHARRLLARERPEVAHAHLSAGCKALRGLAGMVRVATLHIAYKPRQHDHLDAVVAITPGQLDSLPQHLRARSLHVDNWTRSIQPMADARLRLRAQLGIGDGCLLFGTLGRIEPSKGHELLLKAFAAAGFAADVQLVVVGAGRALDRLRRRAPAGVHFTGFSTEPEGWLQAMDGFVSAARIEPFGLVLLEAMQAGLPILATATEGGRHLSALIGRPLVPLADVAALTTALRDFAAASLPRQSYPLERFRLPARLPEFEAWYRQLAAGMQGAAARPP